MISLLIVDDHPLVGNGIAMMLQDVQDVQIAAVCKNGQETLNYLASHPVDIILLDINLPDTDGLQLCGTIRQQNKAVRILALTSTNEAGIITQFLAQGGNGYLLKNMERDELLTAIDEVMNGRIFLSSESNQKILEQYRSVKEAVQQAPILTRREKEIVRLLYEGLTGPQIAERLFLSPYTVETHRKNLMQKLNVNNTQQLLKIAVANKWV
ncbi:MAG: response regulator transcription factor [Chitinophagaceae bacterium]|nr:response regulator transcription factor [Chitinophagaceae bacterium]